MFRILTGLTAVFASLPAHADSPRYPDLPAPTGETSVARNRLFEAVARLLQALAKRAPLIVFIDDVQWADAASLDLLQFATRRWLQLQTRLLLVLTARDDGPSAWRSATSSVHVHEPTASVVVASEALDGESGWRMLAPGELVHVRRDLGVESRIAVPEPPAHLVPLPPGNPNIDT